MTKSYESLSLLIKLLLQFFFGWFIAIFYRIIKYTETHNILTLVGGLLAIPFGFIFWIADFITEILSGKIVLLAD